MHKDYDHELRYRVVTVEETTAPEGMEGDNWCMYVIKLGDSKMVSKKIGSHWAITQHANDVVNLLNDRYTRGGMPYYSSRNRGKI